MIARFQAWLRAADRAASTVRVYATVAGEFVAFAGTHMADDLPARAAAVAVRLARTERAAQQARTALADSAPVAPPRLLEKVLAGASLENVRFTVTTGGWRHGHEAAWIGLVLGTPWIVLDAADAAGDRGSAQGRSSSASGAAARFRVGGAVAARTGMTRSSWSRPAVRSAW